MQPLNQVLMNSEHIKFQMGDALLWPRVVFHLLFWVFSWSKIYFSELLSCGLSKPSLGYVWVVSILNYVSLCVLPCYAVKFVCYYLLCVHG